MESPTSPVSDAQTVSAAAKLVSTTEDSAADLALQEQLIQNITSDDLEVLRKVGFKTVLKPHQKVIINLNPTFRLQIFAHKSNYRKELRSL